MRQQILKARKYRRTELFHSQREEVHKNKLVFNITYSLIFSNLQNILFKIHLLTRDREHRKVFQNVAIIGFKKRKSLKDILVKAKVPPSLNHHLRSAYTIRLRNLNCASMKFTFLFVKPVISNTQEAPRNLEVDLIIIDVRIGTF